MSMMRCHGCAGLIDTDEVVGEHFGDAFYCDECAVELAEEPCEGSGGADCNCIPCLARREYP